jgi:hypothetical protein
MQIVESYLFGFGGMRTPRNSCLACNNHTAGDLACPTVQTCKSELPFTVKECQTGQVNAKQRENYTRIIYLACIVPLLLLAMSSVVAIPFHTTPSHDFPFPWTSASSCLQNLYCRRAS